MKIKRLLALIMMICMCLSLLCACAQNGTQTDDGAKDTSGSDTSTDIPIGITGNTYNGATFNVLVGSQAGDAFNDFKFAEEEMTVLDEAIQRKNMVVEQMFDVVIDYTEKLGDSSAYNEVQTACASEDLLYHLAFVSGYDIVPLAYNGFIADLKKTPIIDLSKSWWDQNANEEFAIGDKLFFTTGDISIQDDRQQNCIAFNKDLYTQAGHTDDIYKLVEEKQWTFDKLYSYAKAFTDDFNGDGTMNMEDQYGILTWDDSIYGVFSSGGTKILNIDDGEIKMTFKSDEAVFNALVTYTETIKDIGINYSQRKSEGAGDAAVRMFVENRAMFLFGRISSFASFRDMETNYGILPYPKYTEDQENYYTILSGYHANYVCTINLKKDLEMRGEITEALAYYSSLHLTPAFQEKTLKGTHVRDDESIVSLEIMAESRIYDLGYMLRPGKIDAQLIYLFRDLDTTYASTFEKYTILARNDIKKANEGFAALTD